MYESLCGDMHILAICKLLNCLAEKYIRVVMRETRQSGEHNLILNLHLRLGHSF